MKIIVWVKANAKKDSVEKIDGEKYRVFLKAPPQEGKANQRLIKVLAEYFSVTQSSELIQSGLKSRNKSVVIRGE